MSPQDSSLDKPIFSTSVAADILGLHPRTLRIYEANGLVTPVRGPGNQRWYSQKDIQRIRIIRALTQGAGVELTGVKVILGIMEELDRYNLPAEDILKNALSNLRYY